jgi:uncharacterized protein YjeT (DUF2065 family)
MQLHIPTGIMGWTIFATGLLIVSYRIHGIDSPRPWVETVERQFVHMTNLRLFGALAIIIALALAFFGGALAGVYGIIGTLFVMSLAILLLVGLGLLAFQNTLRHIVFATAEASDAIIRGMSVVIVLIGLGFMLAPFFF